MHLGALFSQSMQIRDRSGWPSRIFHIDGVNLDFACLNSQMRHFFSRSTTAATLHFDSSKLRLNDLDSVVKLADLRWFSALPSFSRILTLMEKNQLIQLLTTCESSMLRCKSICKYGK
jgi:hypothetical protein